MNALKSVVVTGAAGFIGGHLCQRLVNLGCENVLAIDSLRSGDWSRAPASIIQRELEISSNGLDSWIEILTGVDVLFHLAAEKYNSSKSTPQILLQTNVLATETVFRAAAIAKVPRIVFTSSLYVYGSSGIECMRETDIPRPNTLYGASKLMGEHMLSSIDKDYVLSWNCARPFFIYGPKQFASGGYKSVIISNFERILRGERPIINGDGLQTLDYVFVDDCVDALVQLAISSTDRKTINIASGVPISILDLTELMLSISESRLDPIFCDPDSTHKTSRWGSTKSAEDQFGWRSTTSLVDGLSSVHKWMTSLGPPSD